MSAPLPTPLAAALGVVPTVVGQVRRLPMRAVQLPILAVSSALTGLDSARREYEALAARGEKLLARLRGSSVDELEDRVEQPLQRTPLARPYDAVEDALEEAADTVTTLARRARSAPQAARKAPAAARSAAGETARSVAERLDRAAETVEDLSGSAAGAAKEDSGRAGDAAEQPAADTASDATAEGEAKQAPKGEPTPKAIQPDDTRLDTAASAVTVKTVEQVSRAVGGDVLEHGELPLPDYDHMTLGSLRGRMRSLDLPQLVQIRDYEKAHADRLPIVTMLDNRIAKLANDPTAPLSGGSPADARRPAASSAAAEGGSKVSPQTSGPPINPPSQGDPTNPSQPR